MKKIALLLLMLQGLLMSATLHHVDIKGQSVPVILEEEHSLPVVSMQIVFKNAGSLTDTKNGIANLSKMLLNEGTKKDGASKFSEKLESKAIGLSVGTGRETFVYEISSLKEHFNDALKFTKELLQDPNYTEETVAKIKTKVEGTILRKEADFDYTASVNLTKELFKGTPRELPSIGTKESVDSITLKDIKEFVGKRVVLSKAIVVIGGDVNEQEAKKASEKLLSSLEIGKDGELKFTPISKKRKNVEIKKETQQAYVYFGAPLNLENSDDEYIAKTAAFILGSGGFGSRMMEEIRVKRGLAYSAYGKFNLNKTSSYFSGYLQTKLESEAEAKKVVQELVGEFVKEGATGDELEDAKKFLLGSEPLRVETMSQRLDRSFNEYYRGRELGWSKAQLEKTKDLDLKTLNDFIKEHKEIADLTFSVVTK